MAGTYLATTSSTRYQSSSVPSTRKVLLTQTTKSYINASLSSLLTASSPTAYSDFERNDTSKMHATAPDRMDTDAHFLRNAIAARILPKRARHSNVDTCHNTAPAM